MSHLLMSLLMCWRTLRTWQLPTLPCTDPLWARSKVRSCVPHPHSEHTPRLLCLYLLRMMYLSVYFPQQSLIHIDDWFTQFCPLLHHCATVGISLPLFKKIYMYILICWNFLSINWGSTMIQYIIAVIKIHVGCSVLKFFC